MRVGNESSKEERDFLAEQKGPSLTAEELNKVPGFCTGIEQSLVQSFLFSFLKISN